MDTRCPYVMLCVLIFSVVLKLLEWGKTFCNEGSIYYIYMYSAGQVSTTEMSKTARVYMTTYRYVVSN